MEPIDVKTLINLIKKLGADQIKNDYQAESAELVFDRGYHAGRADGMRYAIRLVNETIRAHKSDD